MDSDDLRKSFLVGNLLRRVGGDSQGDSRASLDDDDDDLEGRPGGNGAIPNGTKKPSAPNRWGKRGVSVSADDTLQEHEQQRVPQPAKGKSQKASEGGTAQERASMLKQPEEFEDDDDDKDLFATGDGDDEEDAKPIAAQDAHHGVLNSGNAWGVGQSGSR